METKLPGMEEPEIEIMDGDFGEDYEMTPEEEIFAKATPEQQAFMKSLGEIAAQLTEPCQQEFGLAMQGQSMDSMSEECKQEFSAAAAKVPEFARQQEAAIQAQADMARRMNGRQPDPNTGKYLAIALVVLFAGIVGYIVYVNKKLKEAGLMDRRAKNLSKKKLEKEKIKEQNRKKVM